MRRSFLPFLVAVAVAACGGKSQSNTQVVPLPPEPKVAEPKPAEPEEPAEPPMPQGPIEVTLPAAKTEVKLVNAGKGKRAPIKLAPTAGAKQTTELALDFTGGQDGPPAAGGKRDQIAPTVLLAADVETQEVTPEGATRFQMTFSGVDTRDKAGQEINSAEFKSELESLIGATVVGTVAPNGSVGDLTLKVEKPDIKAVGALEFVRLSLLPMWPVLPTEPIGTGAKWTVTSTQNIAGKVEVKKVVSYELVGKKGNVWTIKGTAKITGEDQKLEEGAQLGSISGSGTTEVAFDQGRLIPTTKQVVATNFTITVTPPPEAPAGTQPVSIKFRIEQGNALTPKS
jgi:hypothetical protein